MTSEQLELASLRRELAWLMQSEAVKSMSQKDENGKHKYNIKGLDECIQTLHKRALSAESKLTAANTELIALRAENMRLRRQIEAIADPPACHPQEAPPTKGLSSPASPIPAIKYCNAPAESLRPSSVLPPAGEDARRADEGENRPAESPTLDAEEKQFPLFPGGYHVIGVDLANNSSMTGGMKT